MCSPFWPSPTSSSQCPHPFSWPVKWQLAAPTKWQFSVRCRMLLPLWSVSPAFDTVDLNVKANCAYPMKLVEKHAQILIDVSVQASTPASSSRRGRGVLVAQITTSRSRMNFKQVLVLNLAMDYSPKSCTRLSLAHLDLHRLDVCAVDWTPAFS